MRLGITIEGGVRTGKSVTAYALEALLSKLGAEVTVQDEELSEEAVARKRAAIESGQPLLEGVHVTVRTVQTPRGSEAAEKKG